ncbi:MAG: hypothetical protein ACJZ12_00190 [Candidatus Neomarinimicrobiota bacterium]
MYKKIYLYLIGLILIIGQTIFVFDSKIGSIILLGMLAPILMSFINILVISKLTKDKGNIVAFGYNIAQFIVKTLFLCLLTYVGVKVIELDFKIFVPVLCFTWFVFHIIEGFFTSSLINEKS